MVIQSTHFEHKEIHQATRISPGHEIVSQINNVLVDKQHMGIIKDVRIDKGADLDMAREKCKFIERTPIATKKLNEKQGENTTSKCFIQKILRTDT